MSWRELSKKAKKRCSRRTFLKGTAAIAAGAALSGCSSSDDDLPYIPPQAGNAPYVGPISKYVYSTCPVECLTHSLTCQLVGNEVIRVQPVKRPGDIYFTSGCARGMSRMQFLTENRAVSPMKRIKKGTQKTKDGKHLLKDNSVDQWISISWDQALSEIGAKLKEIKNDPNPSMIYHIMSGNMGPIVNTTTASFFSYVNPSQVNLVGNMCCAGQDAGQIPVYGARNMDTRDTIKDSKCIICWGNNPAETMNTYWHFFMDAKQQGAKLIVIDPRYSGTSQKADIHVGLTPGTDVLFAIGMLRWIFSNDTTATGVGGSTYIDENLLKYRSNAPYLVDISAICEADGTLKTKAYNELYKVRMLEVGGKVRVYDKISSSQVEPEENAGLNLDGSEPAHTQEPDLYYYDQANKITTAYNLMRALYAGDLLSGVAGTGALPAYLATLHDPIYSDADINSICGIDVNIIPAVARAYATSNNFNNHASMIVENMSGGSRTETVGHAVALMCILSLITGNIGGKGNGVDDTGGWSNDAGFQPGVYNGIHAPTANMVGLGFNTQAGQNQNMPFGLLGRRARAAADGTPYDKFYDTNPLEKDPFIKFWWIATKSVCTQLPASDDLKYALAAADCVVAAKPTLNTDTEFADYILPITTPFEYEDLGSNIRNKYMHVMQAGVTPYGQAMSDTQVFRKLAKYVFDDPEAIANFDHDDTWYVKSILDAPGDANNMVANGINGYDDLVERKSIRPKCFGEQYIPLTRQIFKTNGDYARAHIFIAEWAKNAKESIYATAISTCGDNFKTHIDRSPNPARDLCRGPFPRYVPALQSHLDWLPDFPFLGAGRLTGVPQDIDVDYQDIRNKYPLSNVQMKMPRTVHASFTAMSWIREAFGEKGIVLINPKDAAKYGIANGDNVLVQSWSGRIVRVAKVSQLIKEGTTGIENGWWDKYGQKSSSTVGVELPGIMNASHTHNATLVSIRRASQADVEAVMDDWKKDREAR